MFRTRSTGTKRTPGKEVEATPNNMTIEENQKVLLERQVVPISEHEGASAITGVSCYSCFVLTASPPKPPTPIGVCPCNGLKPRPSLMRPRDSIAAPYSGFH